MYKFKLIKGSYVDTRSGDFYKAPVKLESDIRLDEKWPNKFTLLNDIPKEEKSKKSKAKKEVEKKEIEVPIAVTNVAPPVEEKIEVNGDCVNEFFNFSPEETGLSVYKYKSKYYVYDADDLENSLNDKGMTKKLVIPFIKSQCED